MAEDNSKIPTPKRGAFPIPKEILENAVPYKPDKAKPEGDPPGSSPDFPSEPDKKPDERNDEEPPQP